MTTITNWSIIMPKTSTGVPTDTIIRIPRRALAASRARYLARPAVRAAHALNYAAAARSRADHDRPLAGPGLRKRTT
jgi:hypothetical protein